MGSKKECVLSGGFSAQGADPSFLGLIKNLDVGVAGIREQFTMLIHREQLQTAHGSVLFDQPGRSGLGALIDFSDYNERDKSSPLSS